MPNLFLKRVLAFIIDYVVIIAYATCLFLASTFLSSQFDFQLSFDSPFKNQMVSFISLTLPVFLYFFLSERSKSKGTIGKRILKLKVVGATESSRGNLFLRNFLKFLPWEIAHIGVYQIAFYNNENIWVWISLILPQVIVIIYVISVFLSKGKQSVYDKLSRTKISD
ncbi:MAG: RDD family protein [Flavobacteriaceae bacterium]